MTGEVGTGGAVLTGSSSVVMLPSDSGSCALSASLCVAPGAMSVS